MQGTPPPLPPTPPQTVPYATPVPRVGLVTLFFRRFHVGLFLWSMLLIGAWTLFLVLILPRFEESFRDFKLELPQITRFLMASRQFVVNGGWLVLLLVPVALAFAAGALGRGGRWLLVALVTLLFGLLVALTIVGVFQPMMTLMEGMTASPKR